MKPITLFACLIITLQSFAQTTDEAAIREAMNQQVKAWNNGDINGFMQTYWQSDSLLFIGKDVTHGWQTTLEHYKKSYPDTAAMGKLSFNLLSLKPLSAEYFFVIGEWHLARSKDSIGGNFTLLFKKINGKWLIITDHTS